MRPWRRHASVLVACAVVLVAVVAVVAVLVVRDGSGSTTPRLATTGPFAPITITRPSVPTIGGGIPVDVEPVLEPKNFATELAFLPGRFRYRMTVSNDSSLGVINAFQWFPPPAIHVLKVLGSSAGSCRLGGLTGFGGNQFPGLVLAQNVLCERLALKPPSCVCLGDGGAMSISFVTDKQYLAGDVDLRVRKATLQFTRIPLRQGG
jgi:hypothetical protein